MAGSSNALDVSAPTQDLKYMLASNVNVSNFVSVKLSGCSNYDIWKAQMLCLIQSQELLHIIQEEVCLTKKYDILVKGWIFGSLNQKVLKDFVECESARKVWMELESYFDPPIQAPVDQETQDFKYKLALDVYVSDFVYVEPSSRSYYKIWKAQMHSLIKSHGLLHIIDDEYPFPEDKGVHRIKEYDQIVRGWIVDSIASTINVDEESKHSARIEWMQLESLFEPRISYTKGYARTEDLKYIQASNVNVSNFVTVKLSGHSNYLIWSSQMVLFIRSQALYHFIDASHPFPEDKGVRMIEQYEALVLGWIFGSMNEKLFEDRELNGFIVDSVTHVVWKELERRFSSPETYSNTEVAGFKFGTELIRDPPETENTDSNNGRRERLYEAAAEGCWWKAKSILKIHQDAATEPITTNGNTILHLAVEMGHNYFVGKLLEFLKDGNGIGTKNDKGRTALHIAAMVGNKYAAQLLVQKREELLKVEDCNQNRPSASVYARQSNVDTYAYVLKSTLSSDLSDTADAELFFAYVFFTKQYDLVQTFVEKYPEAARREVRILFSLAQNFPTDLGYIESLIYPSFHDVRKKTFERVSLLFHYNIWDKCVDDVLWITKICNNTCCNWLDNISMVLAVPIATFYPIYQLFSLFIGVLRLTFCMLYFLLWKVLAVTVPVIKNIEKTKKEYNVAKKNLSLLCDNVIIDKEIISYCKGILFTALDLDAYEVVDEFLYVHPDAINWKNENGHNIVQHAIINRSEKVYNLIHHIIERTESYITMEDSFKNNLVHLAGRLAPSSVLARTTGAALQLQRELIWHEEVEKLVIPDQLMDMNVDKETPAMAFTREHMDLLKEGENWMKTTAESCSITAALIVTIVFAAAITVPGGSNQDSGIPVFKKEAAFTVFAVFNAFSLFTAATSLLLFLSILTARFSEKDFRLILPRRLILGLLTLFLSTTAMIVAFGAILFLVFCDQRPWMLAPICGFACLPISVIVLVKVPLLVDLIRSTYIPIFGKQSYLDSCKTNRKNTIFMD